MNDNVNIFGGVIIIRYYVIFVDNFIILFLLD